MTEIRRRDLLIGTAIALLGDASRGGTVAGALPWEPGAGSPPQPVPAGPWRYFTAAEGAAVEALADRIIPPDPQTPGGREAGCAVFVDRQLAGPYGRAEGLYNRPPFIKGTDSQGPQSSLTPAEMYRTALAALDRHCQGAHGKSWSGLSTDQQDELLSGLEKGSVSLQGVDGKTFFKALVKDVQEGFFADPLYGGNRDMCAWKMIGFPGAHYDYRDWVGRHNERYPHEPVGIMGRRAWNPKT
jgi:gluconate 2-dehydrogenase gamma chain